MVWGIGRKIDAASSRAKKAMTGDRAPESWNILEFATESVRVTRVRVRVDIETAASFPSSLVAIY